MRKMDEVKSISEKMKCIEEAHSNINNIIKFSSGKNENAGADEITPVFYYVVMKAQPKRVYSNINYIRCFTDQAKASKIAFLLTRFISAVEFTMNLSHFNLKNITKEQFQLNIDEAKRKMMEKQLKKK